MCLTAVDQINVFPETTLYRTFNLLNVCVKATITKAQWLIYLHKARIDTINSIEFCLFDKNKLSC